MFNIWEQSQVIYSEQANQLFNLPAWQQGKTEGQQIIPFLGAGVSVSNRKLTASPTLLDNPPDFAQNRAVLCQPRHRRRQREVIYAYGSFSRSVLTSRRKGLRQF